ncbi:MAG: hypothetical protein HYX41_01085 [Bdellovibrio sp.]|nr:hypothetical protein [Bdellovibrio sp.]
MTDHKKKERLDPQDSALPGIFGSYERFLRRFKVLSSMTILIPVYFVGVACFGLSLAPGAMLLIEAHSRLAGSELWIKGLAYGLCGGLGFLFFGISLLFILPLCNFLLRAKPVPWRGPYYSLHTIRWAMHNIFTYIMRFTFLEFMTPTPLNVLFYRMMGMKIGKGVQINTTHISDPCLIEIGNHVTIGGSATIVGHYGQGGFLVLGPVKIGSDVTIGLRAIILGDVEIGDHAKILPNSVLLPKTRVPAGEIWGGIPAAKLKDILKEKNVT